MSIGIECRRLLISVDFADLAGGYLLVATGGSSAAAISLSRIGDKGRTIWGLVPTAAWNRGRNPDGANGMRMALIYGRFHLVSPGFT